MRTPVLLFACVVLFLIGSSLPACFAFLFGQKSIASIEKKGTGRPRGTVVPRPSTQSEISSLLWMNARLWQKGSPIRSTSTLQLYPEDISSDATEVPLSVSSQSTREKQKTKSRVRLSDGAEQIFSTLSGGKLNEEEWNIIKEAVALREERRKNTSASSSSNASVAPDSAGAHLLEALEDVLNEGEWHIITEMIAAQERAVSALSQPSRSRSSSQTKPDARPVSPEEAYPSWEQKLKAEEWNIVKEVIAMREKARATLSVSAASLPSSSQATSSMAPAVEQAYATMNEMLSKEEWDIIKGLIAEYERSKTTKSSESAVSGNATSSTYAMMKVASTPKVRLSYGTEQTHSALSGGKLNEEEWSIIKDIVALREECRNTSASSSPNASVTPDAAAAHLVEALEDVLNEDEWQIITEMIAAQERVMPTLSQPSWSRSSSQTKPDARPVSPEEAYSSWEQNLKAEEWNIVKEVVAMREKTMATLSSSTSSLPSSSQATSSFTQAVERVYAAMNEVLNQEEWDIIRAIMTEHERSKTTMSSKSAVNGNATSSTYAMKSNGTNINQSAVPSKARSGPPTTARNAESVGVNDMTELLANKPMKMNHASSSIFSKHRDMESAEKMLKSTPQQSITRSSESTANVNATKATKENTAKASGAFSAQKYSAGQKEMIMTGLSKSSAPSDIRKTATSAELSVRIPERPSLPLHLPFSESTAVFKARNRLVLKAGKKSRWGVQEIEKAVISSGIPVIPEEYRSDFSSDEYERRSRTVREPSKQSVTVDMVNTAISPSGASRKNERLFEARNHSVAQAGENARWGYQEVEKAATSAGVAVPRRPSSLTSAKKKSGSSFHDNAPKDEKSRAVEEQPKQPAGVATVKAGNSVTSSHKVNLFDARNRLLVEAGEKSRWSYQEVEKAAVSAGLPFPPKRASSSSLASNVSRERASSSAKTELIDETSASTAAAMTTKASSIYRPAGFSVSPGMMKGAASTAKPSSFGPKTSSSWKSSTPAPTTSNPFGSYLGSIPSQRSSGMENTTKVTSTEPVASAPAPAAASTPQASVPVRSAPAESMTTTNSSTNSPVGFSASPGMMKGAASTAKPSSFGPKTSSSWKSSTPAPATSNHFGSYLGSMSSQRSSGMENTTKVTPTEPVEPAPAAASTPQASVPVPSAPAESMTTTNSSTNSPVGFSVSPGMMKGAASTAKPSLFGPKTSSSWKSSAPAPATNNPFGSYLGSMPLQGSKEMENTTEVTSTEPIASEPAPAAASTPPAPVHSTSAPASISMTSPTAATSSTDSPAGFSVSPGMMKGAASTAKPSSFGPKTSSSWKSSAPAPATNNPFGSYLGSMPLQGSKEMENTTKVTSTEPIASEPEPAAASTPPAPVRSTSAPASVSMTSPTAATSSTDSPAGFSVSPGMMKGAASTAKPSSFGPKTSSSWKSSAPAPATNNPFGSYLGSMPLQGSSDMEDRTNEMPDFLAPSSRPASSAATDKNEPATSGTQSTSLFAAHKEPLKSKPSKACNIASENDENSSSYFGTHSGGRDRVPSSYTIAPPPSDAGAPLEFRREETIEESSSYEANPEPAKNFPRRSTQAFPGKAANTHRLVTVMGPAMTGVPIAPVSRELDDALGASRDGGTSYESQFYSDPAATSSLLPGSEPLKSVPQNGRSSFNTAFSADMARWESTRSRTTNGNVGILVGEEISRPFSFASPATESNAAFRGPARTVSRNMPEDAFGMRMKAFRVRAEEVLERNSYSASTTQEDLVTLESEPSIPTPLPAPRQPVTGTVPLVRKMGPHTSVPMYASGAHWIATTPETTQRNLGSVARSRSWGVQTYRSAAVEPDESLEAFDNSSSVPRGRLENWTDDKAAVALAQTRSKANQSPPSSSPVERKNGIASPSTYDPNQSAWMSAALEVDYRVLNDPTNSPPVHPSYPASTTSSSSTSNPTVPNNPSSPFQDPLTPPAPRGSGAGNGTFAPEASWKSTEPKSDNDVT